jgi:hypothetical protein
MKPFGIKSTLCLAACLSGVVYAQPQPETAGSKALWVALQCERDTSNDLARYACIAKRADPDSPQQWVAQGWDLLVGSQARKEGHEANAIKAFKAAAKAGYPPAYQGLAIAYSHSEPALSAMWRQVAATSGMAEEATTYIKRLSPSPVHAATFRLIACHPASFNERKLVQPDDTDATLKAAAASGLETLRKRQADSARQQAEGFRACNLPASYYLAPLNAIELAQARKVTREALVKVQEATRKFPELAMLAWPAYEQLQP